MIVKIKINHYQHMFFRIKLLIIINNNNKLKVGELIRMKIERKDGEKLMMIGAGNLATADLLNI